MSDRDTARIVPGSRSPTPQQRAEALFPTRLNAITGKWDVRQPSSAEIAAAIRDAVAEKDAEINRLRAGLLRVGTLTRWVGWLGVYKDHGVPGAQEDMLEIREVARSLTGKDFEEYT